MSNGEGDAVISHTGSTNDDEELAQALRLSVLSLDAFDEQVAQLHPEDSEPAWADHALGAATLCGDGRDDAVAAPDSPLRSPHEQDTQPQSSEPVPANDEGRQATSSNDNSEPDLEFLLTLSQLPADIFDEQVGELDRRRESRAVTEDRVASLRMEMSLLKENARGALGGIPASWLGGDSSVHDDYSQALALARRGTSLLERYESSGMLGDLEEALGALRNANEFLPEDHPEKAACLHDLGSSFLRRFKRLGDLVDVGQAITAQQQAVRLTPAGHPDEPGLLSNLGVSFQSRFERLGDLIDLDQAIIAQQQAVGLTPDDHPSKPGCLNNLGISFQCRFKRLGDLVDFDQGITAQQQAVSLTPNGHPDKPAHLNNLGISFLLRFQRLRDLVNLDEAITAQQQAVRLTPDGHPKKPGCLNNLGISFLRRFECLGDLVNLDQAVTAQQEAVRLTPYGHPDKPGCLNNLGMSFRRRFERLGDLVDLDQAITAQQQAVRLTPDGHPDKPAHLNNLGNSLQSRFERLGDLDNLDQAITAQQQAVHATPDVHPDKPGYLNSLGTSLQSRFERLGDLVDLDQAITAKQRAIHITPYGHPDQPGRLGNLGVSFQSRFERLGDLIDLDQAITAQQLGVRLTPDGDADKPGCLNNLGNSFQSRFERLGDLIDLDEAITAQQQAVRLTPDGHPNKPIHLNNLGISSLRRFQHLGDLVNLDQAITAQQQAVGLTPDDHPGKCACLSNLGVSFFRRFERLGDLVDLGQAITAQQQAVHFTPDGHPDKPRRLNNLGITFCHRFQRLGDLVDVDQAITAQQQAVSLTPDDHPGKPGRLGNLGMSFLRRFERLGDLVNLNQAITVNQQAVHLTPDDHPHKPRWLGNLGGSFQRRFERLGDLVDLDQAITASQQAVRLTPDGHPDKPGHLNNLGTSFRTQLRHQPDDATVAQAISTYSQSAKSSSGPPSHRFTAAEHWALLCFSIQSPQTLDAYSTLVTLIPRVVWLGRTIEQRYRDVSRIGDAMTRAVSAAIHFGEINLALEWAEQGRSIVWGQLLRLRTPLDELRQHHPSEANELERISRALDTSGVAHPDGSVQVQPTDAAPHPLEEVAQTHRRLAEEYDHMIARIQGLPGFSEFLQPAKSMSLCDTATSGPVVIVNAHKARCDALVLQPHSSQVLHVPLPDLQISALQEMQVELVGLIRGADIVQRRDGPHLEVNFSDVLRGLWLRIVEPILRHLKLLGKPTSDKMPHITWCLAGPLTFLPIHAAGLYDTKDKPKIFHYVVSSYTPTLASLIRAKRRSRNPSHMTQLLAISQPATPGQSRLPGTVNEVNAIQTLQDETGQLNVTWLDDQKATVAAVLLHIQECSWIHLACHGVQNIINPINSAFLLFDKPLTLKDIMKQSFSHTELAFLSACQTASGDHELPEEAIHLAAGMLMAGYGSVVATMWSIGDGDAPIIAEKFYRYLIEEANGDSGRAAYALHHAVAHLRDVIGESNFTRWVPFIHLGICSPHLLSK